MLYIRGKGKLGCLNGTMKAPKPKDSTYAKWDAENATIMAWLLYSMELEISGSYLFLESTKQIWDAVSQAFSLVDNKACL